MEGCILNFEFFDSTLITDSDHNILIADLDTSEIISNNWAYTQLVSSNNSDKRLIYHFADLTSDHCKDGHLVLELLVFSVFRYKRPDRKDRGLMIDI